MVVHVHTVRVQACFLALCTRREDGSHKLHTMRVPQQKRRVTKARHHALTKAHHMMLLTVFANQSASKWLCPRRDRMLVSHAEACRQLQTGLVFQVWQKQRGQAA